MLEYIVIGALAVVVVFVLLIYQKLNSKDKSEDFADISNKLDNIDKAQSNIEELNTKITDFSNLFSDKFQSEKKLTFSLIVVDNLIQNQKVGSK